MRWTRLLAVAGTALAVVGCEPEATAPQTSPTASAALASSMAGANPNGLLFRSDSLDRSGSFFIREPDRLLAAWVGELKLAGDHFSAFLYYSVRACYYGPDWCWYDWGGSDVESGAGEIPLSDATGSGIGTMAVSTNTTAEANPGFTRFAGAGGVVDLRWTQADTVSYVSHDQGRIDLGGLTLFYNTRGAAHSARVTGTVVGTVIDGRGWLSEAWGHTMAVRQGP